MKLPRPVLVVMTGLTLVAAVVAEDASRRVIHRQYRIAVKDRQEADVRAQQAVTAQQRLHQELDQEQRRSAELGEALLSARAQLEETTGRWSADLRNARELTMRLATAQQQMDQLQGELALALQSQQGPKAGQRSAAVQLERIVVHSAPDIGRGKIVSVHPEWSFIVMDLGWNAVRVGDLVSIMRDNQLLAKARVDRVQETVSAATILPEWDADQIRVHDVVRVL